MSECEITPCEKQEYESELIPSTTGFNLVERMTPQTIPNQNTIYSNGDDLFVWDGEKYVPMVGRGCNLPLDIQLYGTWTGQLDEMVYVDERKVEAINTGISIQDAPSDLIYFFFTIECDGEYSEETDLSNKNFWSGVSWGVLGRYSDGKISGGFIQGYPKVIRPQNTSEIVVPPSGGASGITMNYTTSNVYFVRSVDRQSYACQAIMGGNYTVNVYGLKLGNFQ